MMVTIRFKNNDGAEDARTHLTRKGVTALPVGARRTHLSFDVPEGIESAFLEELQLLGVEPELQSKGT